MEVRHRHSKPSTTTSSTTDIKPNTKEPTAGVDTKQDIKPQAEMLRTWARQNRWVVLALASGACAAFNGVFAKLTTNNLTTTIANFLSSGMGLEQYEKAVEVIVRGGFFGLNIGFNGIMWTLFTLSLSSSPSATKVSVLNTSTNFVLTALLGLAIFGEKLPPLWWVGAGMLVAGNVIIGRKDEGGAKDGVEGGGGRDREGGDGREEEERGPLVGRDVDVEGGRAGDDGNKSDSGSSNSEAEGEAEDVDVERRG